MTRLSDDAMLRLEIEADMFRLRATRELAEELVRSRGWSEKDDDYWFQVEDEAKRQWNEEMDREFWKRCNPREYEDE